MSDIAKTLIGIGIILVCVGLFIGSYLLNKKTPKPEGCQNMEESCEGCQILSCAHNLNKKENKEEK